MKKILHTISLILIRSIALAQPLLQWENHFDFEGGVDIPFITKVSNSGDVYVSCISNVDTFQNDILTIKINSDDTTAWYNIIRNDYDDRADGLVLDNEGNCYVGGNLGDIFLDSSSFILRYNDDGSEAWIDNIFGSLTNLVIDNVDNISLLFGGPNIRVSKYSPYGNILM